MCDCDTKSLFKRVFASHSKEEPCKFEVKIKFALLEMEYESLLKRFNLQTKLVSHYKDALHVHECSRHVNDDDSQVLNKRISRARLDSETATKMGKLI